MPSPHLINSPPLPPPKSQDDSPLPGSYKLGIVAILGCVPPTPMPPGSLRRTLSADMSSRTWLSQNGFPPAKKAAEEDARPNKGAGRDAAPEGTSMRDDGTWNSILFQTGTGSKTLPAPYVHPLVKRSKSMLSTQSLDICTESLGSETGSDGFSSYPASEVGDMESEDCLEQSQQERTSSVATAFDVFEFYEAAEYVAAADARKTRLRSFPPPIQTLSQGNGGSLCMQTRRDNGRLVLDAVSIHLEKNFVARRQEGRLVLTFSTDDQSSGDDEEEISEETEDKLVMEMDEDIFVDGDKEEIGMVEITPESIQERLSGGGTINVQMLPMMLNKQTATLNRNTTPEGKYSDALDYGEAEEENPTLLQQSLSTRQSATPTVTASTVLNAYDYFWRKKSTMTTDGASTTKAQSGGNNINEAWESRFPRQDGGLAPALHGCISPGGTNLLWEPKCIATS
ncbi:hypothetical protein MLD38_011281 [Melastoma candidum]|uniref:Uncharacterized protein n=1 Tax=Melastoma candidum TaxID=119954 RepID=A0ACB9R4B3_9MYRT|nr:hypothetical protein MLD38_011281 [Melastoma candidum]